MIVSVASCTPFPKNNSCKKKNNIKTILGIFAVSYDADYSIFLPFILVVILITYHTLIFKANIYVFEVLVRSVKTLIFLSYTVSGMLHESNKLGQSSKCSIITHSIQFFFNSINNK